MCDRGILEKIRNNKIHENNEPKNRVLIYFTALFLQKEGWNY